MDPPSSRMRAWREREVQQKVAAIVEPMKKTVATYS
jgi:hypothetical protein